MVGTFNMRALVNETVLLSEDPLLSFFFIENQENADLGFLFRAVLLSARRQYFSSWVSYWHQMALWFMSGMPVFQPSMGLLSCLIHTDVSGVDLREVKPPFGAFCVQLPDGFWSSDGVPVRLLSFSMTRDLRNLPDGSSSLTLASGGISEFLSAAKSCIEPCFRVFAPRIDGKLLDHCDYIEENGRFTHEAAVDTTRSILPVTEQDSMVLNLSRALWVGLCLYIAERGRGRLISRPRGAGGRRSTEPAKRGSPMVWELGREVEFDRELYESARACETVGGYRIACRFTVRGHWRNQACGKRGADRKPVWIKPHWKGPRDGERISHLYTNKSESPEGVKGIRQ